MFHLRRKLAPSPALQGSEMLATLLSFGIRHRQANAWLLLLTHHPPTPKKDTVGGFRALRQYPHVNPAVKRVCTYIQVSSIINVAATELASSHKFGDNNQLPRAPWRATQGSRRRLLSLGNWRGCSTATTSTPASWGRTSRRPMLSFGKLGKTTATPVRLPSIRTQRLWTQVGFLKRMRVPTASWPTNKLAWSTRSGWQSLLHRSRILLWKRASGCC